MNKKNIKKAALLKAAFFIEERFYCLIKADPI